MNEISCIRKARNRSASAGSHFPIRRTLGKLCVPKKSATVGMTDIWPVAESREDPNANPSRVDPSQIVRFGAAFQPKGKEVLFATVFSKVRL